MDVFTPGSHGSTFGGNALAAAVGLEALRVMRTKAWWSKAACWASTCWARLRAMDTPCAQSSARPRPAGRCRARSRASPARATVCESLLEGRAVEGDARHGGPFGAAAGDRKARSRLGDSTSSRNARRVARKPNLFRMADGNQRRGPWERHQQKSSVAALLMCRPEHFGVIYSINPWMNPASWAREARRWPPARRSMGAPVTARCRPRRDVDSCRRLRRPARSRVHRQCRRGDGPQRAAGAVSAIPNARPRKAHYRSGFPRAAGARHRRQVTPMPEA